MIGYGAQMVKEADFRLRWVLIRWVAVAMCLGQVEIAHSAEQGERVSALEAKLDQTLELVRALSQRVEELEAQLARSKELDGGNGGVAVARPSGGEGPGTVTQPLDGNGQMAVTQPSGAKPSQPAATADQAETAARIASLEQELSQMAGGSARAVDESGLPLHGFADVGAGNHNAQFPEYKGFDIAELDLFLTPRLGPRTRALFELNFEVGEDGSLGVDLERAHIGYQFSDTVWLLQHGVSSWAGDCDFSASASIPGV
jgi:hypothetical protein